LAESKRVHNARADTPAAWGRTCWFGRPYGDSQNRWCRDFRTEVNSRRLGRGGVFQPWETLNQAEFPKSKKNDADSGRFVPGAEAYPRVRLDLAKFSNPNGTSTGALLPPKLPQ
jgi:hypothetical protein